MKLVNLSFVSLWRERLDYHVSTIQKPKASSTLILGLNASPETACMPLQQKCLFWFPHGRFGLWGYDYKEFMIDIFLDLPFS